MEQYHSKLLEKAVTEFSRLPGIGRRTALRLVLHLLKRQTQDVNSLAVALTNFRENIKECSVCHNLSDDDLCFVCTNPSREQTLICVVESIRDVIAIESTNQFRGLYHVLGGIISPMDGIGPADLTINSLEERLNAGGVKEVILALSTTMEGDTTSFYLFKRLSKYPVLISTIARGVAFGDELEYADEITLGRSIVNRMNYNNSGV